MSSTTPNETTRDPPAATLGELLYADKSRTRVLETEWSGLLQAIGAGDAAALQVLYARTHRIVFTLIMRIVDNRETAEELTVDVFHQVWRQAATYEPESGTVLGWIMNQARSRAIDRLRFEQRKKRTPPCADGQESDSVAVCPDEALQTLDQRRLLQLALTGLSSPERQAIETAFFGEHSYNETAARLGQPVGTVKTRIRSGLQKLRQTLAPKGKEL